MKIHSPADLGLLEVRDLTYQFASYFDPASGHYLRTGIFDKTGQETGQDPFRAAFPHLLDIGIMGHCEHGLSGLCELAQVDCYQSGASVSQPNMSLEDFTSIAAQCQGRVFQFALGGRGDPEMHEDFEEILKAARSRGIVPNLTTSGLCLTADKAQLIKAYCGAAAVSWYRKPYTFKAIDLLLTAGVKTNIHYILSDSTIDEAIEMIKYRRFPEGINRVIFLLFKPIGQGAGRTVLKANDSRVREFFELIDRRENIGLTGFDSCSIPALVNFGQNIDPRCYDACEAARFSAYITPDLKMVPCSFDQNHSWAVDLHAHSIEEAWETPAFEAFRNRMLNRCPECPSQDLCMGGCPIQPEIVLCSQVQDHDQE